MKFSVKNTFFINYLEIELSIIIGHKMKFSIKETNYMFVNLIKVYNIFSKINILFIFFKQTIQSEKKY